MSSSTRPNANEETSTALFFRAGNLNPENPEPSASRNPVAYPKTRETSRGRPSERRSERVGDSRLATRFWHPARLLDSLFVTVSRFSRTVPHEAGTEAFPNEPASRAHRLARVGSVSSVGANGADFANAPEMSPPEESVSEADALVRTNAPDALVACAALETSAPTSTPVSRSQRERARSWPRPRASRTPARVGGAGEGPEPTGAFVKFASRGAFRARAACASPRAVSAGAAATTGASITRRAPRARPAPTPPRTPAGRESLVTGWTITVKKKRKKVKTTSVVFED